MLTASERSLVNKSGMHFGKATVLTSLDFSLVKLAILC